MNNEIKTAKETAREPFKVGSLTIQLLPHRLEFTGARIAHVIQKDGMRFSEILTPEEARLYGYRLIIAACESECMQRRALNHPRSTDNQAINIKR